MRIHGEKKTYKGLKLLRRSFKIDIYRSSRLQPRLSVEDFCLEESAGNVGGGDDELGTRPHLTDGLTRDQLANTFEDQDTVQLCDQLASFFSNNDPSKPIATHLGAALCLNGVMMKMLGYHSTVSDQAAATKLLSEFAVEEVNKAIPNSWNFVALQFDRARAESLQEVLVLQGGPVQQLTGLVFPFGVKLLSAVRNQLCFHILASLGNQMSAFPDKGPMPYLAPLVLKAVQAMLTTTGITLSSLINLDETPVWGHGFLCIADSPRHGFLIWKC